MTTFLTRNGLERLQGRRYKIRRATLFAWHHLHSSTGDFSHGNEGYPGRLCQIFIWGATSIALAQLFKIDSKRGCFYKNTPVLAVAHGLSHSPAQPDKYAPIQSHFPAGNLVAGHSKYLRTRQRIRRYGQIQPDCIRRQPDQTHGR